MPKTVTESLPRCTEPGAEGHIAAVIEVDEAELAVQAAQVAKLRAASEAAAESNRLAALNRARSRGSYLEFAGNKYYR